MSLFSGRRSIWKEIKKKENITMALFMYDFSLYRRPSILIFLFLFYVLLAALSVMRGFENRQCWGIYIPANFSNGFLTRKHILQFLSILVFLRLSAAVSLTSTPGLLQITLLAQSPPSPSIFLFSLHSQLNDLKRPHPRLHSECCQSSSPGLIHVKTNKAAEIKQLN